MPRLHMHLHTQINVPDVTLEAAALCREHSFGLDRNLRGEDQDTRYDVAAFYLWATDDGNRTSRLGEPQFSQVTAETSPARSSRPGPVDSSDSSPRAACRTSRRCRSL